jgi:mannose-6-phosphate isomerase
MNNEILYIIQDELKKNCITVDSVDLDRPWGGFFVISEQDAQAFANLYMGGLDINTIKISGKLSPKVLFVKPEMRLSWQYHNRRAEIWNVISGNVGVIRSHTDIEGKLDVFGVGSVLTLNQGERHRLIGLSNWGVIAEIWQHTDLANPSNEEDIIRVQDDFGR